jgi:hypothetical protein
VTLIGHGGTIGREEGAAIRVDAPQVGPLHAKIELVARATGRPEIFVTDLGHPSGTYVSGMRVQRTVLADGDILRVGGALALVVDRDAQLFEGLVTDEGGFVRGPRSKKGWFAAVEKLATPMAENSLGRRVVVVEGAQHCGRSTLAKRIANGWQLTLSTLDLATPPTAAQWAAQGDSVMLLNLETASAATIDLLPKKLTAKNIFVVVFTSHSIDAMSVDINDLLAGAIVSVPPLDLRREELPSVIRHAFEERGVPAQRLSIELYEALVRAAWPGEFSELLSLVDEIVKGTPDAAKYGPEHIPRPLARRGGRTGVGVAGEDLESRIRAVLSQFKGSVAAAARALHLSRQALYREAARLGIDIRKGKSASE